MSKVERETRRMNTETARHKAQAERDKAYTEAHQANMERRVAEGERAIINDADKASRAEAFNNKVVQPVKSGATAAKNFFTNPATKEGAKAFAKGAGKFAVKGVLPGVGVALMADDVFQLVTGQVPILHHQPEPGRTQFLPVARNAHMDNPHNDTANSVDSLDTKLIEMNEQSFRFDPPTVCSYCDDGCDEGCNPVTARPLDLNPDTAVEPLEKWSAEVSDIASAFKANEGEMWADRLSEVYGSEGSAKLPDLLTQTDNVAQALRQAVKTSDDMGVHAFDAFRSAIRAGREEMQQRVNDENSLGGWLGDFFTHRRGDDSLDHLKEKTAKVNESSAENDASVKALTDALAAWAAKEPNKGDGKGGDQKPGGRHDYNNNPKVDETTPPPASDTPLPADVPPADDGGDDWYKKLYDLLNSKGDTPSPFDGLGGDPMSGMPGGGMPSMPSMGSGGGDPFGGAGAPPLGGGEDPFDDDKDGDDDKGDDKDEDDDKDGDDDDGKKVEDPDVPGDDTPPGDVTPPVDGDAPAPAPDVHSDDVTARTVTLPDGRAITFPDQKTADMVRSMVSAEDGAPVSVYSAASQAGFDLPPQGQDIGTKIQPGDMAPGDVVAGDNGKSGVYLGGDDVLLEDKSIAKLSDMGEFNGANQGVFHLDSGSEGGDSAPSQPLGSGADLHSGEGSTSTPGQVTEQVGTPGVPSDDTSASAAPGGSSESTTGMDPSTAFPG